MNINIKRKALEKSLEMGLISLDEYLNELENLTNREYTNFSKKLTNFNYQELIL